MGHWAIYTGKAHLTEQPEEAAKEGSG